MTNKTLSDDELKRANLLGREYVGNSICSPGTIRS